MVGQEFGARADAPGRAVEALRKIDQCFCLRQRQAGGSTGQKLPIARRQDIFERPSGSAPFLGLGLGLGSLAQGDTRGFVTGLLWDLAGWVLVAGSLGATYLADPDAEYPPGIAGLTLLTGYGRGAGSNAHYEGVPSPAALRRSVDMVLR